MAVELKKHNLHAYENIKKHLEKSNKTCVIHPTGTGKSYLTMKYLEDNLHKHTLILAPTYAILFQFKKNILKTLLNIPSDQLKEMDVESVASTYFPDIDFEIYYNVEKNIVDKKYDNIILDEFHRCGAIEWGKSINKLLENNASAKVLGLSATPIRYLDDGRDMSIEIFDGDVASTMSLAEAIMEGILPAPTNVNAIYSYKESIDRIQNIINEYGEAKKRVELQRELDYLKNEVENAYGLDDIFEKYITKKDSKFIVFCKNIEDLKIKKEKAKEWFSKVNNNITMYDVCHFKGVDKNQEQINAFENNNDDSLKLLFAIEMLNEGLHVDNIDGVIMLRPTTSPILYLQQLGRALSVGLKNSPLIFDIVNNIDCLDQTVKLRNSLEDELNRTIDRYGNEISEEEKEKRKEIFDEFRVFDEVRDISQRISLLYDTVSDSWNQKFEEFKKFLEDSKGEYPTTKTNKKLAEWVNSQRMAYNHGKPQNDGSIRYASYIITPERIDQLNSINFMWKTQTPEERFNEKFNELIKFLEDSKGEYPTKKTNAKLYNWVSSQRAIYNRGKKQEDGSIKFAGYTLTKDQIDRLNSINFIWKVQIQTPKERFNERFNELIKYLEKSKGEYPTKEKNNKLAQWVNTQRMIYNHGERQEDGSITFTSYKSDGSIRYDGYILTKEQIDQLNSINFIWKAQTPEEIFDERFNELKDYLEKKGEYPTKKFNEKLTVWVDRLRRIYGNGEQQKDGSIRLDGYVLTQEQIERLKSIGFIFVKGVGRFNSKIINNRGKLEGVRRYLEDKLDEISINNPNADINGIKNMFVDDLNTPSKKR